MEIHAHVPKFGKTASHWLLEAIFIVASVGLGFALAGYRESRGEHELVGRVLRNVHAEIEQNLAVLTPQIAAHRAWIQALARADAAQPSQSAFDILAAARPGDAANIAPLRHGAWDTAVASGALRLLDYDLAARLAEIYGAQTTTYDSLGRMVTAALYTTAMFDPSARAEAIQVGRHVLDEVAGNEGYLKGLYEKHLPALNDAIAEHR